MSSAPQQDKELAKAIGRRARAARTALGLTQAEVAERVPLAAEVYGRLERGGMLPSVPTLMRLASVLSVEPSALVGASDTPAMIRDAAGPGRDLPSRSIRHVVELMAALPDEDQRRVRSMVSAAVAMRDDAAAKRARRPARS
jgi:transcriptional regulator with XRE-family HTH domain